MKCVVLTGGGTAGHCTPNIALIPHLKNYFDKIIYVGSYEGIEKDLAIKNNLEYFPINCVKLKRDKILSNISIPIKLSKAIKEAKYTLKLIKPNVIFSKGGYVSLPVVIAGKMLKIPVISHESDLTVGLSNKIASHFSKSTLTSFPETAKSIKRGIYVGPPLGCISPCKINPLNSKILNFTPNKPIIFITGGSQGSRTINNVVINSLNLILDKFCVIHQCGKNNLSNITLKDYYQCEFLSDMQSIYKLCSICIARAGSNTIFELISNNVPTIFIPLPKGASRGDQILNAKYFNKKGLCSIIEQENLSPKSLYEQIIQTYEKRNQLISLMQKENVVDSCPLIAEIISKNAL